MTQRASMGLYLFEKNKSELRKIDIKLDCLEIPNALVSHCNKVLHSSYVTLEKQLGQTIDPDVYDELDELTQRVFDSWVALGYREGGENNSDSF